MREARLDRKINVSEPLINLVRKKEPTVVIGLDQNGMQSVIPFIFGNTPSKHCRGTDGIFTIRVMIMELGKPVFSP
ncbi:hypothetical protein CFY87_06190 [Actinobacillus seminis]|uniref:Uncharacterized protein n=1 Tax=Actinobacillus seminis TaxID=722 RepID=A0ABX4FM50_9PAST|nr:hypothetical protein CFY87_06190 [Actinobacillus seminis]